MKLLHQGGVEAELSLRLELSVSESPQSLHYDFLTSIVRKQPGFLIASPTCSAPFYALMSNISYPCYLVAKIKANQLPSCYNGHVHWHLLLDLHKQF